VVDEARLATSFGAVAREYAQGRPGYPAAALDRLSEGLELRADSLVVDLAAGTGKLTEELTARFDRVIAVEPLEGMRRELSAQVPAAEVLEGTAEEMPLPDGCADAVFVAQAFHWFDGARALAEIERVLKPGGGLGLLWNTTPWENREGPWFAGLDDVLEKSRADLSTLRRHASGRWMEAFDRDTQFQPLAHSVFPNPMRSTREDFLAGLGSRSYIASMEDEDREEVLREIQGLLDREDAPVEGDEVITPMRTETFWTRLR
jgi:ubiquinone/menaquinone biosynthesis C-methylase UbiE